METVVTIGPGRHGRRSRVTRVAIANAAEPATINSTAAATTSVPVQAEDYGAAVLLAPHSVKGGKKEEYWFALRAAGTVFRVEALLYVLQDWEEKEGVLQVASGIAVCCLILSIDWKVCPRRVSSAWIRRRVQRSVQLRTLEENLYMSSSTDNKRLHCSPR